MPEYYKYQLIPGDVGARLGMGYRNVHIRDDIQLFESNFVNCMEVAVHQIARG